mmetsp:Transcript_18773/g.55053  ORF Transcript_18773/g.55053 Transcript_18773/m.55053 type:complete len:137 (+) Transcript_18773:952-1362(+)
MFANGGLRAYAAGSDDVLFFQQAEYMLQCINDTNAMAELAQAHGCDIYALTTLLHKASLASCGTNAAVLLRDAPSALSMDEQEAVLVLDIFDRTLITHIGGSMVYRLMQTGCASSRRTRLQAASTLPCRPSSRLCA